MDFTSELYEADYYNGWLVITDKTTKKNECVQLTNNNGRNITLAQFKSSIKSHGLNKACATFVKLAATYKPTSTNCSQNASRTVPLDLAELRRCLAMRQA